jgi:hypothetical protein
VAALALGYLKHEPARDLIDDRALESPLYQVALALLGDGERLAPAYFDGSTGNRELQLAAVEAVVRSGGQNGLEYAVRYKQAAHYKEPEQVLSRLKTMLIDNNAPGLDEVKKAESLKELAGWFETHGAEYRRGLRSE